MRKPLIAGNWKMNGTKDGITDLVTILVAGEVNNVDMLVIPPFVYLEQVGRELGESGIRLGAQNVDWRAQGALTGEIEASMLKEVGCELCLTGHSERRQLFAETDDQVACKFKACLEHDVTPILCVGETLQQRQAGQTMEVVLRQVRSVMEAVGPAGIGQGIVAYEPVWAIGTGEPASSQHAQEIIKSCRRVVRQLAFSAADSIRFLYGGSVNSGNIVELIAQPDIDGALAGGASLKADEFTKLIAATGSA